MKINSILLLTIITVVLGKNVANLDRFSGGHGVSERNDDVKDNSNKPLEKRKNTYNLDKLKALHGGYEKREAKNTYNLDKLKALQGDYGKRDAKYTVDLKKLEALQRDVEKRDAKYTVDLNLFKGIEEKEKRNDVSLLDMTAISVLFDQNLNEENVEQVYFRIKDDDSVDNLLQSVLPSISEVSIFAGYIRDNTDIFEKTGSENEIMVLFAPTNNAISHKLNGCKPWEFPIKLVDDDAENEIIIQRNIEHFLSGHIISNFEEKIVLHRDSIIESELINGSEIKIKQTVDDDIFQLSMDGNSWIEAKYVKQVKNGFIFVIDDVFVNC